MFCSFDKIYLIKIIFEYPQSTGEKNHELAEQEKYDTEIFKMYTICL